MRAFRTLLAVLLLAPAAWGAGPRTGYLGLSYGNSTEYNRSLDVLDSCIANLSGVRNTAGLCPMPMQSVLGNAANTQVLFDRQGMVAGDTTTTDGAGNLNANSISLRCGGNGCLLQLQDLGTHPQPPATGFLNIYNVGSFLFYKTPSSAGVGSPGTPILPIISTWAMPFGPPNSNSLNANAADTCRCHMLTLLQEIIGLNRLSYDVGTTDAGDHVEWALYALDGGTKYFQATADVATGGATVSINTLAAPIMFPGEYWLCDTMNNATPGARIRSSGESTSGAVRSAKFTQACTGGLAPATLTTPTKTWGNNAVPAVELTVE